MANQDGRKDGRESLFASSASRLQESLLERMKQRKPPSSESPEPEASSDTALLGTVQKRVINELEVSALGGVSDEGELKRRIEPVLEVVCAREFPNLTKFQKNQVVAALIDDITGLGPLQRLMTDETISEIMVNGPTQVYVERRGVIAPVNIRFRDDDHVLQIIDKIVTPIGRRIDESSPMVDARLPDGSRVNAVIPPISLKGPLLTIRKFSKIPLTIANLIHLGALTGEMAKFLEAAVIAEANIIIAGGTGSGKTTFLNVLSSFIPQGDRIITIEDAAELQLHQPHVLSLEARPVNIEGRGEISIRDLVRNSLRMRPDRIVIGEVRGAEALDMLQAMNTGHDGSLSTIHANSCRDALSRLETMILFTGIELPLRAIRDQIASAIDIILFLERLSDGSRRVTEVSEVTGTEGDVIVTQKLFHFEKKGKLNGKILGDFHHADIRPKLYDRFAALGISF
ncbi:pilus assembly protein CpaF [Heliobacterium gestii]|nr:CpaF family protein [Heliomicrobium gestii]MBM7866198.1 pilus assembly protein CpaF [Heliomicrobium gestii]